MKNIKMILLSVAFCIAAVGCEKYEDDFSSVKDTTITETTYTTIETETTIEEETTLISETTTEVTTTEVATTITMTETTTIAASETTKRARATTSEITEASIVFNPTKPVVAHNIINRPAETTYYSEEVVDNVKGEEMVTTFPVSDIDTTVSVDTTIEEVTITDTETLVSESEETLLTTTEETTSEILIATEEEVIETDEYVVYKPSTNYIHRSTCHWVNDTCIKINEIGDLRPRICTECKPNEIIEIPVYTPSNGDKTYVKQFNKGTMYFYGCPKKGGSGRQLIDCSVGDGEVKGSIASSYLYLNYGYNYNGKRTKVYLEIIDPWGKQDFSNMNGYYYLDDCCSFSYPNVIDFFFVNGKSSPFYNQGIVTVDCWIVNY